MDARRSNGVGRRVSGAGRAGTALVAAGVLGAVLLAAGCSSGGAPDPPAPSSVDLEPSSPSPSSLTSSTPPSPAVPVDLPADLPDDVLLPASALPVPDGPRVVSPGVVAWRLPETCDTGAPSTAVAMTTVQQGDGLYEVPVGVQQVAVHADAAAAQVEAERIGAALAACAAATDSGASTRFLLAPAAVGADGTQLSVDYSGVTATDPAAVGLGYAVVLVRRGSAVTLVAAEGGEDSFTHSAGVATDLAQAAWQRLCRYTVDGCAA